MDSGLSVWVRIDTLAVAAQPHCLSEAAQPIACMNLVQDPLRENFSECPRSEQHCNPPMVLSLTMQSHWELEVQAKKINRFVDQALDVHVIVGRILTIPKLHSSITL